MSRKQSLNNRIILTFSLALRILKSSSRKHLNQSSSAAAAAAEAEDQSCENKTLAIDQSEMNKVLDSLRHSQQQILESGVHPERLGGVSNLFRLKLRAFLGLMNLSDDPFRNLSPLDPVQFMQYVLWLDSKENSSIENSHKASSVLVSVSKESIQGLIAKNNNLSNSQIFLSQRSQVQTQGNESSVPFRSSATGESLLSMLYDISEVMVDTIRLKNEFIPQRMVVALQNVIILGFDEFKLLQKEPKDNHNLSNRQHERYQYHRIKRYLLEMIMKIVMQLLPSQQDFVIEEYILQRVELLLVVIRNGMKQLIEKEIVLNNFEETLKSSRVRVCQSSPEEWGMKLVAEAMTAAREFPKLNPYFVDILVTISSIPGVKTSTCPSEKPV